MPQQIHIYIYHLPRWYVYPRFLKLVPRYQRELRCPLINSLNLPWHSSFTAYRPSPLYPHCNTHTHCSTLVAPDEDAAEEEGAHLSCSEDSKVPHMIPSFFALSWLDIPVQHTYRAPLSVYRALLGILKGSFECVGGRWACVRLIRCPIFSLYPGLTSLRHTCVAVCCSVLQCVAVCCNA